ncbi:MAG: PAS domain S-box protein [Deltaproteobacteria bacterium]|nr:PAS domain S-box protein [Deltaproteobacteria bacterium]
MIESISQQIIKTIGAAESFEQALDGILKICLHESGLNAGAIIVPYLQHGFRIACMQELPASHKKILDSPSIDSLYGRTVLQQLPFYGPAKALFFQESQKNSEQISDGIALVPITYKHRIIAALHIIAHNCDEIAYSTRTIFEDIAILSAGILSHLADFELITQKNKELVHQEQHFSTVIKLIHDAVISFDNQDNIIFWNHAAQSIFGYFASQALNMRVPSLLPSRYRDTHEHYKVQLVTINKDKIDDIPNVDNHLTNQELLSISKSKSIEDSIEIMGQRQDGSLFPARFLGRTWQSNNQTYYTYLVRDLTQERQLESVASAINVMENIGYVFSGIRHELGNPVNNIKTTLAVLQRKLDEYEKENIREHLSWITLEVSRVEYLLQSLKGFSMFENPVEEDINVSIFLEEFQQLVQNDLQKRFIQLNLELDPNARSLCADPRALQQVMLNLISNAIDAVSDRVEPTITIKTIRRESWIAIAVHDNGCGMTHQQLQQLFKPFYTTKRSGTGLGLSLVHKMVSQMNGSIAFDSVVEQGTTATIYLPESVSREP